MLCVKSDPATDAWQFYQQKNVLRFETRHCMTANHYALVLSGVHVVRIDNQLATANCRVIGFGVTSINASTK